MSKPLKRKYQNDAKEQISLQIGGDEYREYVLDRQGVDETMQEYVTDAKMDMEDAVLDEERVERVEKDAEHRIEERTESSERAMSVGQMKYNRQMKKWTQQKALANMAIATAAKTETTVDDAMAPKVVRKAVPHLVYDDAVLEDDFIPTALNKYL